MIQNSFQHVKPDWKYINDQTYSCSRALASLGIMGAQLRVPLKPPNTIVFKISSLFLHKITVLTWHGVEIKSLPRIVVVAHVDGGAGRGGAGQL